MEFTIRPANEETDGDFVQGLNARLVDVIHAPTHGSDEVADFQDRFTSSAWNKEPGNSVTFVAIAESGDKLGYVNVRETDDEIANEKCGYIALLAIVQEAESKGVAQSLMSAAANWAKEMGYSRLALDVFASNQRGRRFYEKEGFQTETMRIVKRL